MIANLHTARESYADVFESVLSEKSGEVFAVNFSEKATEGLIEVLGSLERPPKVRLLARESVLKWIRSDFVVASAAAELVASENLELRTTDEGFENVLLVSEQTVVSIILTDTST